MKLLKNVSGFTKIELIVVSCVIGVLASAGVPAVSSMIPNYQLRSAARDLYSNMHLAKMTAIRENKKCKLTYSLNPDQYTIDCLNKTVILSDYGNNIRFQGPNGKTFNKKRTLTFNSRGFSDQLYAYLSNGNKASFYRVGPLWSGVVKFRKWDGKNWK